MTGLKTFVYQPTLDALVLRKDKGADYVLSWKSKGVYNSKLKPLYPAFLNSMKLSKYRTGIKFDKDLLAVKSNIQKCNCLHCLWFRCLAKKLY